MQPSTERGRAVETPLRSGTEYIRPVERFIKTACAVAHFRFALTPFASSIQTMLDLAPHGNYDGTVLYSTNHAAYPPVVQSPQAQLLPFPAKKSPQSSPQYSPASVHGFDPFAEDSSDETASSSGSDVSRVSSLADFSRQRDQDYRVAAWVNYGSSCVSNVLS